MANIEEAIKQKVFNSEYLKAHVNILYTSSWLNYQMVIVLKEFGISTPQFNVLRILRGANNKPISVKELTSRMIDKTSNSSRLVDKLEKKGFARRTASEVDRRRVDVVLTASGLNCVNLASVKVENRIDEIFQGLKQEEAQELNALLNQTRNSPSSDTEAST